MSESRSRSPVRTEAKTEDQFTVFCTQSYMVITRSQPTMASTPAKTDTDQKHSTDVSNKNTDLHQIASTIASNLSFIKQAESYIPEEEFKLLIKCISLPSNMQYTFFTQLMTISDLLIKRKQWANDSLEIKSHLKKVLDALYSMPEYIDRSYNYHYVSKSDVIVPKESPTINYLYDNVLPQQRENSSTLLMKGYFKSITFLKNDDQDLVSQLLSEYSYAYNKTILITNIMTLDEEKKYLLLQESFKSFKPTKYRHQRPNLIPLFELLKNHCVNHEERITFYEKLLLAFKNSIANDNDQHLCQFKHEKAADIANIFYYIITSAKTELSLDEIKSIMKKIDFQFILDDAFIQNEYFFLPKLIAFMKDEITEANLLNSNFFRQTIRSQAQNYLYFFLEIIGEQATYKMNLHSTNLSRLPISLPPLLTNTLSENPNFIEFITKLKQEFDEARQDIQDTPLTFLAKHQYEVNQIFQLQLSEHFLLEELDTKNIFIKKMLLGLSILKLDEKDINILLSYFKNHPQEINNFIENVSKLAAIAEAGVTLPLDYKRSVFKTGNPSENKIHTFLGSLQSTATHWPKLTDSIPLSLLNQTTTDLSLIDPLVQLKERFKKANEKEIENGEPEITDMKNALEHYEDSINLFIKLTGHIGADYIQKQIIGASLLPLGRLLDTLPALDATWISAFSPYFNTHSNKNNINALKNCLIAINILKNLRPSTGEGSIDFYLQISHNRNPNEFLFETLKIILKTIFDDRTDILDELFKKGQDALLKNITMEELSNLFLGGSNIKGTEYYPFFLTLLWNDIIGISYDTEQTDILKNMLASHNNAIQQKLIKNQINPADALASYQDTEKSVDLIIWPTGMTDADKAHANQLVALWNYLLKVEESLTQQANSSNDLTDKKEPVTLESFQTIQEAITIKKFIAELKRNILKKQQDETDQTPAIVAALSSAIGSELIGKINTACSTLKNKEHTESKKYTQFVEFSEHVTTHLLKFQLKKPEEEKKSAKNENQKKEKMKPKFIRIQQWDKSNQRTFFLGDDVNCCLATTGTQFQAMVERRLDDALFFFVATDQSQNEPVALIWCYLAETKQGDIVLMANFFEVRVNFGINDHLRLSILYGLLEFTNQYLKDNPNIKGFYMSKLSYGLNVNDLNTYSIRPLALHDKLGGPFKTQKDYVYYFIHEQVFKNPIELTTTLYFLRSLEETEFRFFDPKIAAQNRPASIMTINELLVSFIQTNQDESKWVNTDEMLKKLVAAHGAELSLFYNDPFQNNQLKSLVSQQLEFYIVKKILKAKSLPEEQINDTYGITALHLAIKCGDVDAVNALLQSKDPNIDINKKSHLGVTPISLATELNALPIVKLLLEDKEHGIDPNIRDADGKTPLYKAVIAGHTAVIQELLMSPIIKTQNIHVSEDVNLLKIENHLLAFERLLRDKNLNPKTTHIDLTPLHIAICLGNIEALKLMILAGFNINETTTNNISSLDLANTLQRSEIIDLLTAINKINDFNIENADIKKTIIKSICDSKNPINTVSEIIHNLHKLKELNKYGINTEENQRMIAQAGNKASQTGYRFWKSKVEEILLKQKKSIPIYPSLQGHAASALKYGIFTPQRNEMEAYWHAISYPATTDEKKPNTSDKLEARGNNATSAQSPKINGK